MRPIRQDIIQSVADARVATSTTSVPHMPLTFAMDPRGNSVHHIARKEWQARIGKIHIKAG